MTACYDCTSALVGKSSFVGKSGSSGVSDSSTATTTKSAGAIKYGLKPAGERTLGGSKHNSSFNAGVTAKAQTQQQATPQAAAAAGEITET